MALFQVALVSIQTFKVSISVTVAILLFLPLSLVHMQVGTDIEIKNDTVFIACPFSYQIPRANVKVTDKDLTDSMHLPEGTVLHDQLYQLAKCKASTQKVGISNAGCSCRGYSLIHFCGVIAAFAGLLSVGDLIWIAKKRMITFTVIECQNGRRCAAYLLVLYLFICAIVLLYLVSLSGNFRYSLPNSVYEREYYEIPLAWLIVVFICPVYVFVSMCEILFVFDSDINTIASQKLKSAAPSQSLPRPIITQIENETAKPEVIRPTAYPIVSKWLASALKPSQLYSPVSSLFDLESVLESSETVASIASLANVKKGTLDITTSSASTARLEPFTTKGDEKCTCDQSFLL